MVAGRSPVPYRYSRGLASACGWDRRFGWGDRSVVGLGWDNAVITLFVFGFETGAYSECGRALVDFIPIGRGAVFKLDENAMGIDRIGVFAGATLIGRLVYIASKTSVLIGGSVYRGIRMYI